MPEARNMSFVATHPCIVFTDPFIPSRSQKCGFAYERVTSLHSMSEGWGNDYFYKIFGWVCVFCVCLFFVLFLYFSLYRKKNTKWSYGHVGCKWHLASQILVLPMEQYGAVWHCCRFVSLLPSVCQQLVQQSWISYSKNWWGSTVNSKCNQSRSLILVKNICAQLSIFFFSLYSCYPPNKVFLL